MERNRRVVRLIGATGETTLQYEDGKTEHLVFSGSDVTLMEHTPTGACQRCGHSRHLHGAWDWDGEDEVWVARPCDQGDCDEWVPFTPWLAVGD